MLQGEQVLETGIRRAQADRQGERGGSTDRAGFGQQRGGEEEEHLSMGPLRLHRKCMGRRYPDRDNPHNHHRGRVHVHARHHQQFRSRGHH